MSWSVSQFAPSQATSTSSQFQIKIKKKKMGKIKRTVLIFVNYGENLKNPREKSRYE